MIPITLVVGFLGSGKTTLMRRVVAANRDQRMVYLVNEFSAADVDSFILQQESDKVISIAGGSIFCKCKVNDFIQTLGQIAGLQSPVRRTWDGVVIEASGMANPKSIATMLSETKLDQIYELAQVICIIDPGSFVKLIQMLPAIRDQIEAADRIIINKADLFDTAEIDRIEKTIREINPLASIVRTVRCETEIDLAPVTHVGLLEGIPYDDPNPALMSIDIQPKAPFDVERARRLAENLGDIVYRLKGFVRTDRATIEIEASISGWSTSTVTEDAPSRLVLIGPTEKSRELEHFASQLRTGSA